MWGKMRAHTLCHVHGAALDEVEWATGLYDVRRKEIE